MSRDLPFAEALAQRLPLPLAQLYRRAHNAKSPLDRSLAAYFLWEAGLKLLASAAVVVYAENGEPDAALAQCLQKLARPALGDWWELVWRLTPILAKAGDPHFAAVRDLVLGRGRGDLPGAAELNAVLCEELGESAPGGKLVVRDLFERLVRYRNRDMGHGAAGLRPSRFYDRLGRALLTGMAELFERLDVLAGRRLIYVAEVRSQADGTWLVERYELVGESARRVPSQELPEGAGATLPRPQCVYLEGAAAATPVALHPLVVHDFEADALLFLNARRGGRHGEYLCYGTGRVAERADLSGERSALLARVLGMEVAGAAVEGWVAQARDEEKAAEPPQPAAPLRRLGEFELLSELGRGGMGVVYRAWQPSLGRHVALKALFRTGDARAEARFAREVRALGRVEHPNLVKIYTSGTDGEQWFYAMELLEGATLAAVGERLQAKAASALDWPTWQATLSTVCEESRRQEKPLSEGGESARPAQHVHVSGVVPGAAVIGPSYVRHVVGLMRQVAEAAHALHSAGVIHRDIKPGNIMVLGDGGQAVLMDLGLAQLADETNGRLTRTRQFVGTLRYASPEQVLAVGLLDGRSDVYSLGATLWELLTLRPMFDANEENTSTPELMRRIQVEDAPRPRRYHPGLPRDLEAVVLKCLEKDPRRRYATAQELADELRRFLDGEPVRARPVGLAERAWRWCRRNPARVAVAGLGLLTILAGVGLLIGWLFAAEQARAARELAAEEARTEAALAEAQEQRRLADKFRGEAEHLNALLTLKHGMALCDEGDTGRGLLHMAHSLALCPQDAPDLQRRIRTALPSTAADLHTLEAVFAHPDPTTAAAFSPDGKTLLIGGARPCRLDVATGRPCAGPAPSAREVATAVFSPDGKLFVTGSLTGVVRLTEAAGGTDLEPLIQHPGTVKSVAFSPDGKKLLVAAQDRTTLACYDVATRRPAEPTFACRDQVYAVTYSPDGKRVATAAIQNNARLWDAATGQPLGPPLVHPGVVFAVAFSPDGKTLVTGCLDGGARFWDVASGQQVGPTLRHRGPIRSVAFSGDGRLLLTSSEDGTARVWETSTGRPVGQPLAHPAELRCAVFTPDDSHVLTAGLERTARLWRLARERALVKLLPQAGAVAAVAFSPDGKLALTGCQESAGKPGESRLWDVATGAALGPTLPQEGQVMVVAFSPDGKLAATGGNEGTVRLWRTADRSPAQPPWQHRSIVAAVAFSPDGRLAAVGGREGRVELREVDGGRVVNAWPAFDRDRWVWSLAFSPDGRTLLSGGQTLARLWSVPDGRLIGQPMKHDAGVRTALLSPDGHVVLTCSLDKTARLWSARDGRALSPPLEHKGEVRGGAFSPDGRIVATAAADGTVRLWEVPGGRSLAPPLLHDSWVRSVAFSPDGKTLVAACDDGTAQLWGADGAALGAFLPHQGPVNRVAFSPDGTTVLTGSSDGRARLWTPPPSVGGDPAHVALWMQVLTGMELDAEGTVQVLPAEDWLQRRRRLQERGGPPLAGS
jgi:WD40 repeat protein/serine/threonine protein kinase